MGLIEDMLDNLDRENLVKVTLYNVSGTKYVDTVLVNKLLSEHFSKMKGLKAEVDLPLNRTDITECLLSNINFLMKSLL